MAASVGSHGRLSAGGVVQSCIVPVWRGHEERRGFQMKCFGGRSYDFLEAKGLDEGTREEDETVMTHQACGWECNFTETGITWRGPGTSERRNRGVSKIQVFASSL